MTDDIVTILREIAKRGVGRTVDNAGNCIPTRAADEIERLRKELELAYYNLKPVLEVAKDCLESPHPLWGFLNECFEDIMRMEKTLNIANDRMFPDD